MQDGSGKPDEARGGAASHSADAGATLKTRRQKWLRAAPFFPHTQPSWRQAFFKALTHNVIDVSSILTWAVENGSAWANGLFSSENWGEDQISHNLNDASVSVKKTPNVFFL